MAVHVVVTCSKRKRSSGFPIRLSAIHGETLEERAQVWRSRLSNGGGPRIPAGDLYQGEQWALLRDLRSEQAGSDLRFWILSAGYGLIPFDAPIHEYHATFTRGHPDSVFNPAYGSYESVVTEWWESLGEWDGTVETQRSLPAIISQDPAATLMIAASPVYLRAIGAELEEAGRRIQDPDQLLVFSGGADSNGARHGSFLSFDARLQSRVGGSLMALNVRVLAEVLVNGGGLRRPEVQALLHAWTAASPEQHNPSRAPIEDSAVRDFIRSELARDPNARWTPLLRKLRDGRGRACEQKRFRALYRQVSAEMDAA